MAGTDRNPDGHRLTHVGLCVSDLSRSLSFYQGVLGFREVARRLQVTDDGSATLLGLPAPLDVELVYLERDGVRIELIHYHRPVAATDDRPRRMDLTGLTHLAFRVGDFDGLCARIRDAGGAVLEGTIATFAMGNRGIMALDPDGVRIELIERPG